MEGLFYSQDSGKWIRDLGAQHHYL